MKKLTSELEDFRQSLVLMGNLTEQMVSRATEILVDPSELAQSGHRVNEMEEQLDQTQLRIDKEAIRLLTVYSPVAGDLRLIMSITRITTELERIGDHAVNMCEALELLAGNGIPKLPPRVLQMARTVNGMINDALNAFAQNDIERAQSTIAKDNIVDALNDQLMGELLRVDVAREILAGSQDISSALGQLLIARSLERIADQATNISEEVVYMVKGDDIRHQ